MPPLRRQRNAMALAGLLLIVAAMGTLVYYAVPLYRLFCEVTGFGGTTRAAQAAPTAVIDRKITVRFDANVASGLPWRFIAPMPVTLRLGEEGVIAYKGQNIGNEPYLGTATFNVTPFKAGEYFNKIQCFCFTEQLLLPGEEKEFTVSFFVDPKFAEDPNTRDVSTITLSYTFFDKGAQARDRYMREHKVSYAPGSARGDAASASRAAPGVNAATSGQIEGSLDAPPSRAQQ
ncbi:MAG: cytochrome c oxidase assembly protein [Rhodospirillales bacterium]|nr:cytochrome c oxidase assembly protein [Rhodospirillales bacterium]